MMMTSHRINRQQASHNRIKPLEQVNRQLRAEQILHQYPLLPPPPPSSSHHDLKLTHPLHTTHLIHKAQPQPHPIPTPLQQQTVLPLLLPSTGTTCQKRLQPKKTKKQTTPTSYILPRAKTPNVNDPFPLYANDCCATIPSSLNGNLKQPRTSQTSNLVTGEHLSSSSTPKMLFADIRSLRDNCSKEVNNIVERRLGRGKGREASEWECIRICILNASALRSSTVYRFGDRGI